ncbi:MAG TPA: beta-ketoacyl synthase N-terminal-like domain-containing protein, partial [Thermoanaerobaculia bacterium]|nr:beta-ketoacyl synthase N-terminal-like domain-containing protein [Thermoanaerobaculia bacterium]
MTVVVRGVGVARSADESDPLADPARLRRMDRFARIGFLAGSRALAHAGRSREGEVDARAGVVFGTAFGCRDSITEHAE